MPPKKEMEEVMAWCDKRKEESKRVALIEKNPFREKFRWMFRYPFIEIDRPIEVASKHNIVYDSTTRTLWVFLNGSWRKIEEDFSVS
ncbi:MAG: hypothetical protein D6769_01325 [Methanobacteriota archaeon]|nr:MAG: hypothetical protein D6769_01325 [Euryarchaeota archaeon]